MIVQEPLTKRLAHRSLLYAILGDEMRSETLRLMMHWLNHQKAGLECQSDNHDFSKFTFNCADKTEYKKRKIDR